MVKRILVQFKGEGSGAEQLSWGQWAQWGAYQTDGRVVSAGGMMALAEGVTVEQLTNLMGLILSRHQSLRTRIQLDEKGVPHQVVQESGEVVLEVAEAGDDPAEMAEAIRGRYDDLGWDIFEGDPVRMAVVCKNGVASHFVAMYNHFLIDGSGIDALGRDLANLDLDGNRQLKPVEGLTPLEQMRLQQEPSARRQQDVSLRHWENCIRKMPLALFSDSKDLRQPHRWEATYNSPAAHLAVQVLMGRTKLHSGVILLGAYAKALSEVAGQNTIVLRSLVSNRFRPGFADSVSAVAQAALMLIETADCTFDELTTRAFRAQVSGGRHAYYDPRELWALIERVTSERGERPDLTVYYSDRRRAMAQGLAEGPLPTREQVLAALDDSALSWGEPDDEPGATAFFLLNGAKDAIDYTLSVDTHRVSPSQMEAILRTVEKVLIEGAFPSSI